MKDFFYFHFLKTSINKNRTETRFCFSPTSSNHGVSRFGERAELETDKNNQAPPGDSIILNYNHWGNHTKESGEPVDSVILPRSYMVHKISFHLISIDCKMPFFHIINCRYFCF